MQIFGHHVKHQTVWIAAGIGAIIAVVLYLRARASAAAGAAAPAPQPDQGAGMSVAAPTGSVASDYQQQLDNAQLQGQSIANQYQSNLVSQQQKQFDLQQRMAELLAPDMLKQQQSALAVETHFNTALSKAAVSCPGNASLRSVPDAQGNPTYFCRQKTSGGFLGIPLGDIGRTIQNFVGGVEAAAPTIGYQAAQQAASYELGQVFPTKPAAIPNPTVAARPAAPVTPLSPVTATPVPHGYAEIA